MHQGGRRRGGRSLPPRDREARAIEGAAAAWHLFGAADSGEMAGVSGAADEVKPAAARAEAERWFQMQQMQWASSCLHRWSNAVVRIRQRRHIREAKNFVVAPTRQKPRPGQARTGQADAERRRRAGSGGGGSSVSSAASSAVSSGYGQQPGRQRSGASSSSRRDRGARQVCAPAPGPAAVARACCRPGSRRPSSDPHHACLDAGERPARHRRRQLAALGDNWRLVRRLGRQLVAGRELWVRLRAR